MKQPNPSRTAVIAVAIVGAAFLGWLWGALLAALLVLGGYVGPSVSVAELSRGHIPGVVWIWAAIGGCAAGLATAMGLSLFLDE